MRKIIIAAGIITAGLFGAACEPVDGEKEFTVPGAAALNDAPAPSVPLFTPTTSPADSLTVSQRNAVETAESYLEFTHFSRTGLIDQLEYEGFSNADSVFAVDYLSPDWFAQAVGSAESYMQSSSFSQSGLVGQLEYEGFTAEQAAHGAASQF